MRRQPEHDYYTQFTPGLSTRQLGTFYALKNMKKHKKKGLCKKNEMD